MKPLRIGMIGYGGIGRVHALAYRAMTFHYALPASAVQIVGVATTHDKSAQRAAAEIGCDWSTNDYRELLDRDDIDAVDVCVPNHRHEEIVVAAAQAGKHIYCEKPLAMNVEQGRRMVKAAVDAGVKTQMTFNFRYFPAMARARQLVEEGFLGRVFSFHARYFRSSYISQDKPLSWRLKKEIAGGGALFDLGSHVLDLVYFLLGDFHSLQATMDTLIKDRPVSAGAEEKGPVDVDDIALIQARLADGTLGTIDITRMGTGSTNQLVMEIFGDQGAIRFNAEDPSWLEIYDVRDAGQPLGGQRGFRKVETVQRYEGQKAPDWSMTPNFIRTHTECQYQFLRAISDDLDATPSLADGLHVQQTMQAACQSSDEHRWVELSEVG
ncbi:MAG: Gfo/Idh/MocA family oxidoreductase [Pirellulaceae bacterium]|nr:Gfo/Idh/MocA family oxidoreductase [Pirellulaceae bacterium]